MIKRLLAMFQKRKVAPQPQVTADHGPMPVSPICLCGAQPLDTDFDGTWDRNDAWYDMWRCPACGRAIIRNINHREYRTNI